MVRLLCSSDITLALRYYEPIRHPLAFAPLPGHTGYKSYLLLAISDEGEEDFSSCLAYPYLRAIAITPPKLQDVLQLDFILQCCLHSPRKSSAFGIDEFRGYLRVHSRYDPVIRGHPKDDLVNGLQAFDFSPTCHLANTRTQDTFSKAFQTATDSISERNIVGWLKQCRYRITST